MSSPTHPVLKRLFGMQDATPTPTTTQHAQSIYDAMQKQMAMSQANQINSIIGANPYGGAMTNPNWTQSPVNSISPGSQLYQQVVNSGFTSYGEIAIHIEPGVVFESEARVSSEKLKVLADVRIKRAKEEDGKDVLLQDFDSDQLLALIDACHKALIGIRALS